MLLNTCRSVLDDSPAQGSKLQQRVGGEPLEHLVNEVKRAAPFKFPLAISAAEAGRRLEEVKDVAGIAQTLVVLPLIDTDKTAMVVSRAIDEIVEGQGAAILFLPGIGRLRIIDRVKGTDILIERQTLDRIDDAESGSTFERILMTVSADGNPVAEREWRMASSVLGSQHETDRQRLKEAANKLPGRNWDAVHSSPVAVAIPLHREPEDFRPMDGKLCIGLPTQDKTGTPAWVHAHFFGTISRKDIDLTDCEFNRVLFDEAIRLHKLLLQRLKGDPDIRGRRSVTLAYAMSDGPLAAALQGDHSVRSEKIVLDESGADYVEPAEVAVLEPADYRMARRVLDLAGDHRSNLRLPEPWIAENATGLLRALAHHDDKSWAAKFTSRDLGQNSILEAAAQHLRARNAGFAEWEPFLRWALGSFSVQVLLDQQILPTVGGHLAAAAVTTIFLPPIKAPVSAGPEAVKASEDDDAQIDLEAILDEV